ITTDNDLEKLFLAQNDPFNKLLVRNLVRYGIWLIYHIYWINKVAKGYRRKKIFFVTFLWIPAPIF
ncbi:MAG: hypothetical protein ABUL46_06795, partial [Chitinophaga rupis]